MEKDLIRREFARRLFLAWFGNWPNHLLPKRPDPPPFRFITSADWTKDEADAHQAAMTGCPNPKLHEEAGARAKKRREDAQELGLLMWEYMTDEERGRWYAVANWLWDGRLKIHSKAIELHISVQRTDSTV